MKSPRYLGWIAAGAMLLTTPGFSQMSKPTTTTMQEGRGTTIVTVLPKKDDEPLTVRPQNLTITVDGKPSTVTNLVPLRDAPTELVILIDNSARDVGRYFEDIRKFVQQRPANTKVALAYMESGSANLATPLTADHDKALSGLRLTTGTPGSSASPYFCISDLARRWPSDDSTARRLVVVITNGIDPYTSSVSPNNPNVARAVADSARAGMVVNTIYLPIPGMGQRMPLVADSGRNLLSMLASGTGGGSFWMGNSAPVSITPFFRDISQRIENQFGLSFTAQLKHEGEVLPLAVKTDAPQFKVEAPEQVFVGVEGVKANPN